MINIHHLGQQQEFTFLVIHIWVQRTFMEFPRNSHAQYWFQETDPVFQVLMV